MSLLFPEGVYCIRDTHDHRVYRLAVDEAGGHCLTEVKAADIEDAVDRILEHLQLGRFEHENLFQFFTQRHGRRLLRWAKAKLCWKTGNVAMLWVAFRHPLLTLDALFGSHEVGF